MKFIYTCAIFALAAFVLCSASASAQPEQLKDPQFNANVGGSRKDGFNVDANVRKNVWESANGKHAFDVTGGYSQHVGGPYGNSPADKRVGGIYTYRW